MKVEIENYKSVERLEFESRRINVFVGEPNCGKTNIIEALGLLDPRVLPEATNCLRIQNLTQLFTDQEVTILGSIRAGSSLLEFAFDPANGNIEFRGDFDGRIFKNRYQPNQKMPNPVPAGFGSYRYYSFPERMAFKGTEADELTSPFGDNMVNLLATNKHLRTLAADLFSGGGFEFELRPRESQMGLVKRVDGISVSFPYEATSETLRRMLFYRIAVESCREKILLFDEPEANTFPLFTKLFAERLAMDENGNQFFLTTHSPYLLGSLIEKSPRNELAVILCRMRDYRTETKLLDHDAVNELLDLGPDAFFNFDRYWEE